MSNTLLMAVGHGIDSLLANKVRSMLTMLGILIGVAAVMTVISATQASSEIVAEKLAASTSMLTIRPAVLTTASRARAKPMLTEDDVRVFQKEGSHVFGAAGVFEQRVVVVAGARNDTTRLSGVAGRYFEIYGTRFRSGAGWSSTEERSVGGAAVLGGGIATKLFGGNDPVGQTIRIKRTVLHVVGVIDDPDDTRVIAPLRVVRGTIFPGRDRRVDFIVVRPTTQAEANAAKAELTSMLLERRRTTTDFWIASDDGPLKARQASVSTMTLLGTTIAAISLIIGGIGVMNIMLASVAERTREIGIRLAVGARGPDIALQFLVENIVLTSVGGVLGVLVGMAGAGYVAEALELEGVRLSASAALVALAVNVAVGLVFGFLPARRAALLDPIEAMRTE